MPDNEKTECEVEDEPSVEREGPFYFLFTDKDGENTVAQTNLLVWIRHWLQGLLKSRKKNISSAKQYILRFTTKYWCI